MGDRLGTAGAVGFFCVFYFVFVVVVVVVVVAFFCLLANDIIIIFYRVYNSPNAGMERSPQRQV